MLAGAWWVHGEAVWILARKVRAAGSCLFQIQVELLAKDGARELLEGAAGRKIGHEALRRQVHLYPANCGDGEAGHPPGKFGRIALVARNNGHEAVEAWVIVARDYANVLGNPGTAAQELADGGYYVSGLGNQ